MRAAESRRSCHVGGGPSLESDVLLVIQTDARILAYVWIMIGVCHCRTFDSNARFMSDLIRLPADYRQLLESLKGRIRAAQLRAASR